MNYTLCSFFISWSGICLPTHCRCRGLLMHLVTLRHTTLGRTPLGEGSAIAENYTWRNTTLTTDRHPCPRRIRTRNPGKRSATGILLFLLRICFTTMSIAQTRQRRVARWLGVLKWTAFRSGRDFIGIWSGVCLETGECQEDIGYVVRRPGWDMNPGHFPIKMLWSLVSKNKLLLLDPTQQVLTNLSPEDWSRSSSWH
jgi:hypothetical protein